MCSTAGTIDYYAFIETFDNPKEEGELVNDIKQKGNHIVYKHRGDEYGMTAEQAEQKLRQKLRENFSVSNRNIHCVICGAVLLFGMVL